MPRITKSQGKTQEKWETNIARAKKVRKNWKDLFRVDMAREYMDGKQNPGYPAEEWITINQIYSHLKAQLPSLYSADPYFYVRLRRSFSPNPMMIALWEKRGKIRQSYLNYLKEELNLKEKARLCIQDGQFAYGVAKVHYKADEIENPDFGNAMLADDGDFLSDEETGSPIMEPETIPINERYVITRIHPDDFLWDEDASTLEDTWKWVAQCIRMPLSEAKKDKRFNKAALKKLEGKGEVKDEDSKRREERKKGDVKGRSEYDDNRPKVKKQDEIVVLWEIYEIDKKKWHVIAEGGDAPLVTGEPLPPGTEKHPFAILRFTVRDDSPYPHPPISPGIDPQKEFNLSRSRILKHRKRFNRKYEANISMMTEDPDTELSKLESGDDGTYIKVNQTGAIAPIKDAPLDQMGYIEINYLKSDLIELLGGATEESRGIAGAESATQASILDKRLEIKEGDSMSMVIDFVKVIARKLDQLVQTHITKDEAVRVTGPQGEFWEMVRVADYDQIEGEYEYAVNVGSTVPRMPHVERSQWMAFLQLLGNFPQLLLSPTLMKRMAEMHHIEDEAMLQELSTIGQQMMSGQIPEPGASGSQAGVPGKNPQSGTGGQAGGFKSLNMPGAGNIDA
jgi:hypothetical protein